LAVLLFVSKQNYIQRRDKKLNAQEHKPIVSSVTSSLKSCLSDLTFGFKFSTDFFVVFRVILAINDGCFVQSLLLTPLKSWLLMSANPSREIT